MPFVISKFLPRLVSHRVLSINGTDKTTPRGRNLRTRHLCFLPCLNRESSSFTTVCLYTSTRVHHEAAHLSFVVVQTVTSLRACAFESSWEMCVALMVRTHTQINRRTTVQITTDALRYPHTQITGSNYDARTKHGTHTIKSIKRIGQSTTTGSS